MVFRMSIVATEFFFYSLKMMSLYILEVGFILTYVDVIEFICFFLTVKLRLGSLLKGKDLLMFNWLQVFITGWLW